MYQSQSTPLLFISAMLASLLPVQVCADTYNKSSQTSSQLPIEWHMWKEKHGKTYGSFKEELERQIIWQSNIAFINTHNRYNATLGYTLAMNRMGDLSEIEYRRLYGCLDHADNGSTPFPLYSPPLSLTENISYLPDTVDWHTMDAVSAVRDQGQCCSSYAFSAVGAVEGMASLASGYLQILSEQNIIDCSDQYGNHGCTKGAVDVVFNYIIDQGITTYEDYPYTGSRGRCKFWGGDDDDTVSRLTFRGYQWVRKGEEIDLQCAVATEGPISTGIDASHNTFRFYERGVYNQPSCSYNYLNHAVLVIGYGTDEYGRDYWLVKNSWGDSWGERGYIRMSRNKGNQCGIATNALFPTQ